MYTAHTFDLFYTLQSTQGTIPANVLYVPVLCISALVLLISRTNLTQIKKETAYFKIDTILIEYNQNVGEQRIENDFLFVNITSAAKKNKEKEF